MIEINGIAHVILTVTNFERALDFYGRLMPFLGLEKVFEGNDFAYWVGGRTALGIQRCHDAYSSEAFTQYRVGLHHLCFRAKDRDDVDRTAAFLKHLGAEIVRGPQDGDWAPGYYYVLFEDPDKIRLELCHVPGAGLLAEGIVFKPGSDFRAATTQMIQGGSMPKASRRLSRIACFAAGCSRLLHRPQD
jgi:catechol 2,3-dioxygenase-like lactoylglutathione lyase family enzyme